MDAIAHVQNFYAYLCHEIDPRVKDWLFMSEPIQPTIIVIAYLVFVYYGPKWMEKRKPFKLQKILVIYNFSLMIFCAYMIRELLLGGWLYEYSLGCQTVDYSNSPTALRMTKAVWLFFIAKLVELMDTVFFILRKKNSQVTFLHVFHHGCLPMFWWWGVKAVPGGFGTFHGLVNCCVHVVMYFYYGMAALGPKYQKYLWWKRYVTILQLAQFFIITIHNSQMLFIDCAYPKKYVAFIQGFTTLIAILFLNFYIKTYKQNKDARPMQPGTANSRNENGVVVANGKNIEHVANSFKQTHEFLHHRKHANTNL